MQIHDLTRQTPAAGSQMVFDTGSATYKALVSDIAKVIIENYNGTSLAGSSQTPKAAIDSLYGIHRPRYYGSSAVSFANITEGWALAKGTDAPDGGTAFWYVQSMAYGVDSSNHITTGRQIAYGYSANDVAKIYTRVCFNSTWTNWIQLAVVS